MINYFWAEIKGKNTRKFLTQILKLDINILDIKYQKNNILIKISYSDYQKIKKIKTTYQINIIKTCGKKKYLMNLKKYKISLITFIISVFFLCFISHFTLFINIDTNSDSLKQTISNNLEKEKITLYSLKKDYKSLNKISLNIKNNNKDKIEWIELDQKGVLLNVKVIERIDHIKNDKNDYKDIVAEKSGYIRKIESRRGQVQKNTYDYVKKGDVIISGNIIRNENIVSKVRASGKVYAEVWYIVKVNDSLNHKELVPKEKGNLSLVLNTNNKEIILFKLRKKIQSNKTSNIFKNDLLSINIKQEKKYTTKSKKYTSNNLKKILEVRAKKDILDTLEKDEYIIKQKTLKKYIKNGKMYIEVFFKTYEDISKEEDLKNIEEED